MHDTTYIVATIRPWNIRMYHETIKHYAGQWHLIEDPEDLTLSNIRSLKPKYVFFPHWNHIVPPSIVRNVNCVCFHETDLPYGRGGSPIQNLIVAGHHETMISAIRMVEKLDAGPVYLKRRLSLEGLAEEIYGRAARIVASMIKEIIETDPPPVKQVGKATLFRRRKPEQSRVPKKLGSLEELFDHLRMLDASGYPKAFLEWGGFRYEISRPALRTEEIQAEVRIRPIPKGNHV